MDTIEVKNAFEGLVDEMKAITERSAKLRLAVYEAYQVLKHVPLDDPRREAISYARAVLLEALERHRPSGVEVGLPE